VADVPQYLKPLEAAKAYVALIGSIAVGLLAVYGPETPVGQVLTVLAIIATAIGTFVVPNAEAQYGNEAEFGDDVYLDGHSDA